jgi:integrase
MRRKARPDALALPDPSALERQQHAELFEALVHQITGFTDPASGERIPGMVAASSGRIYAQTFRAWRAWADAEGVSPLDLWPAQVGRFLSAAPTVKHTRQRQLSALRKLAQLLYIVTGDPTAERMAGALKLIKPDPDGAISDQRARRALSEDQAMDVLTAWSGDRPIERRNAALIAVLFLTGVRRAEAADLQWADVDAEHGLISIRHGKGDKAREAGIHGDRALRALARWRTAQGPGRRFIFCSVDRWGHPGPDRPISGTDVYRIVQQTELLAGVEFSPHDARRTFITGALAVGTPLADVQAQAGHAQASTTLHYAQPVDARERRRRLKLPYA